MKNIVSYFMMFWGFFLIYISVILTIEISSTNSIYKNDSSFQWVQADLQFFLDERWETDYQPWFWSSENFPLQEVYRQVRIERTPIDPPARVVPQVNNIVRDSH